jgi:aldehyde:ferredoxin oxidoreductase
MNGWMGKIVKFDLTLNKQEVVEISSQLYRQYLGGRGLGVKLYSDMVTPDIDPLAPENPMVFLTGPLTNTPIATAGRYQVISKSPLTGTIVDSSSGGSFGALLKATGIDGFIVTGKAAKPSYIYITEDGIEMRDATHLWGKNTQETKKLVIEETHKKARVASIGPAGENLILFSAIMNDNDRATGRGGMGAVLGSKNLKAIAVYGTQKPTVADPEGLKAFTKKLAKLIDKNPVTGKSLQILGTSVLVNVINAHGMFPTRNFQRGVFNDAEGVSGEKMAETILDKRSACYKCPIACGRVTKTKTRSGEGPEYESLWGFTAMVGCNDLEVAAEANYTCNELGIDTITAASTIGCAMELTEKGALKDGPVWGDSQSLVKLVEDMVYQRGLGKDLSLGSKRLAEKYGYPELAMQVKGLEIPAYDPRGAQGQALSYATSNRGGCHMRAYMIGPEILGQPVFMDRFSTNGKAKLTSIFQDISAMVDSAILCRFLQFACGIGTLTEMLNLVTGETYTDNEVIEIGTRIYNLERVFNQKAGFSRKDDTLPPRFLNEPLLEGGSRNRVVHLEEMLDEYYKIRGWDDQGNPTEETLKSLNI